jgi:hypothetical protein
MRLAQLGIDSLELRRLRQDLIYTYKVVFGLTSDSSSDFFTHVNTGHVTHGNDFKLYCNASRVDVRKFFFSQRVVNPWNELPAKTEHFASLKNFKRFVNTVNLNKYLQQIF